MTQKRYQYWGPEGKVWSQWFEYSSDFREPWQLKGKLKNEYREVDNTNKD